MKFILLALLVASVPAFGRYRVSEVRDCGDEWAIVSLISGSISPDPIPVPGVMLLSVDLDIMDELPSDLNLHSNVHKVAPEHHPIHCLDGLHGSCTIHVCKMIEEQPEVICPSFPANVTCACPLPAGILSLTNVAISYDEQWLNLGFEVDGDYTDRITLTSASSPNGTLGCMELDFTLVQA